MSDTYEDDGEEVCLDCGHVGSPDGFHDCGEDETA
jgi:hypothetical protein